ncbi:hypothetical protein GCM10023261_10370 [Bartonella jaculi]|uniref:Uncharacterized protein n=1 Tax=Bartonella jaculi TaxID=686226 RepID=A0ABP9N5H5_9HYPH
MQACGEISGYYGAHALDHATFVLKDNKVRLEVVIGRRVMEKPNFFLKTRGEMVSVGKLITYWRHQKYQIVIEMLEPTGALMRLLENHKKKFKERLFDAAKKKPLPSMP